MSNNAHELSNRLLNALDSNYNVVDMQTVNEIISILEKFNITKELLETTRLGKHVNELRRKTADPTLARRAKVLVKRWRDLVIPAVASPAHTGSNRSSAERTVRRLGGTPLTSPALSRHVVSPAVPSPRPLSRPAWGGYESDSQDVILVDDDPPPAALPAPPAPHAPFAAHKPSTPPVKRQPSPDLPHDEKKAKRDKKPKKRRGHSRAGSGTETTASGAEHSPGTVPLSAVPPGAVSSPGLAGQAGHAGQTGHAWGARNGSGPERRRNGWRRDAPDPYAALVNRLPPAGAKKVKTTKELLEQIQSRASGRPASPRSPASPDVMLIEPDSYPIKVESPLRNGGSELKKVSLGLEPKLEPKPEPEPVPRPKLEDDREWAECTCGDAEDAACPAAARAALQPLHVHALHHALLPGVNGTRAPLEPHRFTVRSAVRADRPELFASVVPLYFYSDYADDHCAKNLARVPLCAHLPWTSFAPPPPDPPPPPPPPDLRPYPPLDPPASPAARATREPPAPPSPAATEGAERELPPVEPAEPGAVGAPSDEASERLKAPLLTAEDEIQFDAEPQPRVDVEESFAEAPREHRTVERTKADVDGRALYAQCEAAQGAAPFRYSQAGEAPVLALPGGAGGAALAGALEAAAEGARRDARGRPERAAHFAEWHECARLGDLIALPYVVID